MRLTGYDISREVKLVTLIVFVLVRVCFSHVSAVLSRLIFCLPDAKTRKLQFPISTPLYMSPFISDRFP